MRRARVRNSPELRVNRGFHNICREQLRKSRIALTGQVEVPVAATGRVHLALKGSDFEALTVMTRQLWVR